MCYYFIRSTPDNYFNTAYIQSDDFLFHEKRFPNLLVLYNDFKSNPSVENEFYQKTNVPCAFTFILNVFRIQIVSTIAVHTNTYNVCISITNVVPYKDEMCVLNLFTFL